MRTRLFALFFLAACGGTGGTLIASTGASSSTGDECPEYSDAGAGAPCATDCDCCAGSGCTAEKVCAAPCP